MILIAGCTQRGIGGIYPPPFISIFAFSSLTAIGLTNEKEDFSIRLPKYKHMIKKSKNYIIKL